MKRQYGPPHRAHAGALLVGVVGSSTGDRSASNCRNWAIAVLQQTAFYLDYLYTSRSHSIVIVRRGSKMDFSLW
jgi:hypothetical protein